MVQLLTLEGFEADGAADGLEALEKLRSDAPLPHVILLDMMMPRMDGWTFCRERAKHTLASRIPIIVLSAAPPELIRVAAAAVLSKPFDYQTLLDAVRMHC
jgi:two-component system response regulator MprA